MKRGARPKGSRYLLELRELFRAAPVRTYRRGDAVYRMGDRPTHIYFVEQGLVGLTILGDAGKEHLVRVFRANQIFGHRSFFAKENYHATALAIDTTTVRILDQVQMRQMMKGNCDLAEALLETLAKELGRAEAKQVDLSEKEAPARIAEAVVYLKELKPDYDWTRQEIADFCGTTTPTVIRNLARFVEEGLIEQRGREIVILDRPALLAQG